MINDNLESIDGDLSKFKEGINYDIKHEYKLNEKEITKEEYNNLHKDKPDSYKINFINDSHLALTKYNHITESNDTEIKK